MASVALSLLLAALCVLGASAQQTTTPELTYNFTVGFNPSRLSTSFLNYTDGTTPLRGYLAYDRTTTTRRPGVLILPDYDGIGPYEQWRAHQLASLGYVALVADVFGQDIVQGPTLPVPARSNQTQYWNSRIPQYRQRMASGLAALRNVPVVNATQLAAFGYCFGGGGAFELMRSWPNGTDGLRGVAGFHGVPFAATYSNVTAGNPIRILAHLGANDNGFVLANLGKFNDEMTAANVTWEFDIYGLTGHAFTEPWLVGQYASRASGYNEVADERSWYSLRGFLQDIFGMSSQTNPYTATLNEPALASA